jgi:hypothetical protein
LIISLVSGIESREFCALRLVGIEISIKEKMINKNIGFLILLIINNSFDFVLIAANLYIGYKVTKHLKRIDYYH